MKTPIPDKTLRDILIELSDSVYIPNDTKDYTGVKISLDVNEATTAITQWNIKQKIDEINLVLDQQTKDTPEYLRNRLEQLMSEVE